MIRPVGIEDTPALLALLNRVFGPNKRWTARYVKWQCFQGPAGPAIMYGAFHEETLLGFYCLVRSWLSVNGRRVKAVKSILTMVDKAYRRVVLRDELGTDSIFTRLANICFNEAQVEHVGLTYGFPNKYSYRGFTRCLDFRDIGSLTLLVKPIRLKEMLRFKVGLPAPLDTLCGLAAQCLSAALLPCCVEACDTVELQVMSHADPQLDDLAAEAGEVHGVIQVRDCRYIQWRFFEHQSLAYEVLGAYRRGRLVGYIAWMVADRLDWEKRRCPGVAHIVDYVCLADGSATTILSLLIRAACARSRRHGALMAIAVNSPTRYVIKAFRRCGFVALEGRWAPRDLPCIVRGGYLASDGAMVGDLSNWYLTLGDNDVA